MIVFSNRVLIQWFNVIRSANIENITLSTSYTSKNTYICNPCFCTVKTGLYASTEASWNRTDSTASIVCCVYVSSSANFRHAGICVGY